MRSITHKISIPSIVKIEKGSFDLIGDILIDDNIERVTIIIDQNMHNILSERIDKQLKKIKIEFSFLIMDTNLSLRKLSKVAYNLDNKTQLLLGVGGGSIIDRTKYISYLRKIPWISIPTSPSNDGISSPLSSLYIDNKRVSVPAKMPYGIIIDTNIIMNSPYHMIMSGIGDSVSNITAVYDMELESKHTRNQKDDFSAIFSLQSISSLMGLPIMNVRSEKFIESLLTSLVMSGIAMEMSGTSKPSSGS
jgi:glycerol-1-phosphate dehydrogenase [NAD(P)+]